MPTERKKTASPKAAVKLSTAKPGKKATATKAKSQTKAIAKTTTSSSKSKPARGSTPVETKKVVETKKAIVSNKTKPKMKETSKAIGAKTVATKSPVKKTPLKGKVEQKPAKLIAQKPLKTSASSGKPVPKPATPQKKPIAPEAKIAAVKPAAKAKVMKAPSKKADPVPPPTNTKPDIVAKIRNAQAMKELRKDLAQPTPKPSLVQTTPTPKLEKGKDRLILMVRDAYWLHAHWDITRQSVERARVSIAENWHTAKPILRILKIEDTGTTNSAETVFRDIEIHGGVGNWYSGLETTGSSFKLLMGYLTSNGRFFELARSNAVTMPPPGGKDAADDHWADIAKDAEKIYAMSGGYNEDTQSGDLEEVFEERLKRSMDPDVLSQFGSGAEGSLKRHKQFHFEVNAELIVFGSTHPDAHLHVGEEPVKVRSDGSFSIRLPLPDRRQVLPATAKSRDGVDEQTVVIAVERNTKVMEPVSMDADDL
ncbi:MAG: DUF4912 domain-containing protein [Pirellula sp.]